MTFTKILILILIFFSDSVLADEKSCFSDSRMFNDERIVFKEMVDNNFFEQLDSKSLFKKLALGYQKNVYPEKNIHDNSLQQRIVFSSGGLHAEQVKSLKHDKVNTLCAEIQSNEIMRAFITNYDSLKVSDLNDCSMGCEIRISSYDENSVMYIFIKDRTINRIKYINVGYDG